MLVEHFLSAAVVQNAAALDTCLTMARGFLHLLAVMDWHSRYVVAWRLSNTLEINFCTQD